MMKKTNAFVFSDRDTQQQNVTFFKNTFWLDLKNYYSLPLGLGLGLGLLLLQPGGVNVMCLTGLYIFKCLSNTV